MSRRQRAPVTSGTPKDHDFARGNGPRIWAIRVYRDKRTGDLTILQGGCFQTKTNRNGVSRVIYVHMLAKTSKRIVVVDINPVAIEIASRHFSLPDRAECHVDDGAEFLKCECGEFDAIIMDPFCGDQIPDHLHSTEFLRLSRLGLARPHGCFLANICVADPAAQDYAHAAREVWGRVRILDAPRAMYPNAIVIAGAVDDLRPPALMMSPATDAAAVAEEPARARFFDVALDVDRLSGIEHVSSADQPPKGNR